MGSISKLIYLLVVFTFLCHFKVRWFLLGYGVVYLIAPFFLQPDVHPAYEQLLELREEALDLERG